MWVKRRPDSVNPENPASDNQQDFQFSILYTTFAP
jgi:hypothetical protein